MPLYKAKGWMVIYFKADNKEEAFKAVCGFERNLSLDDGACLRFDYGIDDAHTVRDKEVVAAFEEE